MSPSDNSSFTPAQGDWVRSARLGRTGQVVKVDRDRCVAEVQFGSMVSEIAFRDLSPSDDVSSDAARARAGGFRGPTPEVDTKLDLHGLRVEEALEVLDKFLDSAIVNELEHVKIVHGHGTGKLRSAVREFLQDHPQVRGSRFGAAWEGSLAVTIVDLGRRD